MKNTKNIVEEALQDSKLVKEAVLESAKKQVLEQMVPEVKTLINRVINEKMNDEDVDRLRRAKEGHSETEFEEGDQKMGQEKDLDLEKEGLFPEINEMDDEGDMDEMAGCSDGMEDEVPAEESVIPTLGEKHKQDDEVDEDIEISETELEQAYESVMQAEAAVSKGFSDNYKATQGDWAVEGDPKPDGGLLDVKSGEDNPWEEEEPPAKQDFAVKENVKKYIRAGLRENQVLRKALVDSKKIINHLTKKISEVNLFNSKVLHVNRILNAPVKLTKEQKKVVLESIDKASSVRGVRVVYETLINSINATTKSLRESKRRPLANAQRARSTGGSSRKVIKESKQGGSFPSKYARMHQLANLVK